MKICDKCNSPASTAIIFQKDSETFDLCPTCSNEIRESLRTFDGTIKAQNLKRIQKPVVKKR